MIDYHFKLAKIHGEFVWHSHPETDGGFLVNRGKMQIQFLEGAVNLEAGKMFVIPKGIEHKPNTKEEYHFLMIEQSGTLNTGDPGGQRTIEEATWI